MEFSENVGAGGVLVPSPSSVNEETPVAMLVSTLDALDGGLQTLRSWAETNPVALAAAFALLALGLALLGPARHALLSALRRWAYQPEHCTAMQIRPMHAASDDGPGKVTSPDVLALEISGTMHLPWFAILNPPRARLLFRCQDGSRTHSLDMWMTPRWDGCWSYRVAPPPTWRLVDQPGVWLVQLVIDPDGAAQIAQQHMFELLSIESMNRSVRANLILLAQQEGQNLCTDALPVLIGGACSLLAVAELHTPTPSPTARYKLLVRAIVDDELADEITHEVGLDALTQLVPLGWLTITGMKAAAVRITFELRLGGQCVASTSVQASSDCCMVVDREGRLLQEAVPRSLRPVLGREGEALLWAARRV